LTDQVTRDPSLKSLIGLPTDAPPDLIQWRNIVHPEYLPRVDAILAKSREPGSDGSFYVEYPVVGRDGAERWVAECGRMIFDARRRFVYCIGAVFPLQQWTVKRVASRVLLAFACLWCGIETASDFLQAPIADNVIIMLSESRR
jgi:hypothetical protein